MTKQGRTWLILGGLVLAWAAVWGAWIAHPTAPLTQNAVDLAEWSTFLNDVRFGGLRLIPEVLRLAVSLVIVALAVALWRVPDLWARWALRVAVVLPAVVMLPPYPQVLRPWSGEGYAVQFVVVVVAFAGVALTLLTDRLPERPRDFVVAGLCLAAVVAALVAMNALSGPFRAHYAAPLRAGWGLVAFVLGVGAACLMSVMRGRSTPRPVHSPQDESMRVSM